MKKIIVVLPVEPEHKKQLEESIQAEWIYTNPNDVTDEQLQEAFAIIGNVAPSRLLVCKNLKLMQLNSAGTDGYTVPGIIPEGAILCNATGSYGLAISEHLLAMLLMLTKKLYIYHDQQKQSLWRDAGPVVPILGSTTLVLGMGDIGGEFGARMHALGSRVIGIRRTPGEKPEYAEIVDTTENFRNYLPEADFIAMSLPGTKETYHLIGKEELAAMKPGAVLLNVGRGTAIDPDALYEALTNGHLGGCGIDVTEPEPLPAVSPLWQVENLLITPHISGGFHLRETFNRIVSIAAENLHALDTEGTLRNIVDFTTGYRKR